MNLACKKLVKTAELDVSVLLLTRHALKFEKKNGISLIAILFEQVFESSHSSWKDLWVSVWEKEISSQIAEALTAENAWRPFTKVLTNPAW